MPTYVYRCKACEHQFEIVQRITEEPLKECPQCKGKIARLIFPVGIVFKGSGFHVNDYAGSKSSTSESSKSENTKTESAKTESAPPDSSKEATSSSKS